MIAKGITFGLLQDIFHFPAHNQPHPTDQHHERIKKITRRQARIRNGFYIHCTFLAIEPTESRT